MYETYIRFHFIKEKYINKQIKLEYVNTENNVADYLIKVTDIPTSKRLNSIINRKY